MYLILMHIVFLFNQPTTLIDENWIILKRYKYCSIEQVAKENISHCESEHNSTSYQSPQELIVSLYGHQSFAHSPHGCIDFINIGQAKQVNNYSLLCINTLTKIERSG